MVKRIPAEDDQCQTCWGSGTTGKYLLQANLLTLSPSDAEYVPEPCPACDGTGFRVVGDAGTGGREGTAAVTRAAYRVREVVRERKND